MSATNLDLPVLMSSEQIRRREFVTTRRGYDPEQVRAYLDQLADQMEVMRSMLNDARSEAQTAVRAAAEPRIDPYEQLAARIANVIREADGAAERIRAEAQSDADVLTSQARAEADRIRTDAQARAEEARQRANNAVRDAREEADRTIAGLATRRDVLVGQLASMQERLLSVARDLESAMDVKVPEIEPLLSSMPPDAEPGNAQAEAIEPASSEAREYDVDHVEPDEDRGDAPLRTIVVGEAEEPGDDPDDAPTTADPSYGELWEGTEAIKLEFPDIPALDLGWDDLDEGGQAPQH
jgi:DivIVA domain-containing protein